jgi:hypothetical protein
VISANTASAAARAIRRGHDQGGPDHDEGDACEELASRLAGEAEAAFNARQLIGIIDAEAGRTVTVTCPVCGAHATRTLTEGEGAAVRFAVSQDAPPAGPGGTPRITIAVSTEISGEWVQPEVIADSARQLAAALVGRLREQAGEAARESM